MTRKQRAELKKLDSNILPIVFALNTLLRERARIDEPSTVEFILTITQTFMIPEYKEQSHDNL